MPPINQTITSSTDSDHETVSINVTGRTEPRMFKNWTLLTTLSSGLILITASGTEIGCTLFGGALPTQPWMKDATHMEHILVYCMFFIGSIVGGLNAGYFIDSIGRKHTLKIAFGSLTINTLLLILASNNVVALIIARLCSGYTWGLLYVTLIVMAGEIAPFRYRGLLTSTIYFFSFLGAFVFALVNMFYQFQNVNQIIGWISLSLLGLAVPFYYFFALETPHYHCMKNNHSDGLQMLLYLRNERVISNSRKEEFVEIQQSVSRDLQSSNELPIFKSRIFYILLLLRLPVLFSSNQLMNRSQVDIIINGIAPESKYLFQPLLLAGIHVIIGLMAMFTIDRFKRLFFFSIPLVIAALMIIIAGSVLSIKEFNPFLFIILFEIFHGLGIGMTVDILTGEGFAMQKKGIGISLLNLFFMLGHIILIVITMSVELGNATNQIILCVHGAAMLLCGFIRIADTKQRPLAEARGLIRINFLGLNL